MTVKEAEQRANLEIWAAHAQALIREVGSGRWVAVMECLQRMMREALVELSRKVRS